MIGVLGTVACAASATAMWLEYAPPFSPRTQSVLIMLAFAAMGVINFNIDVIFDELKGKRR